MNKSILIIGRGKGIGNSIVKKYENTHNIFSISRSEVKGDKSNVVHIQTDVSNFLENYKEFKNMSLSLIVFVLGQWGETGALTIDEYENFLKTGPFNLLKIFNQLERDGCIEENATIINIGSISSEEALQYNSGTEYPAYSIMKLIQKAIITQLSRIHSNYKLSNITLGSIGEDDNGVGYENLINTIDYLYNLKSGVRLSDVTLISKSDIK